MVEITEELSHPPSPPSRSEERALDADEIESNMAHITRPTARAQIHALVTKIRRDAAALKRMEESQSKCQSEPSGIDEASPDEAPTETQRNDEDKESIPDVAKDMPIIDQPPGAASAQTINKTKPLAKKKFLSIDKFSFDAGSYNTPNVTLYIPLPSSSPPPSKVECNFTNTSFNLLIDYDDDEAGSKGRKQYKLIKDNLEKEIDGDKCKYIVKKDKVVIKLRKVKGEYGMYDSWTGLTAKSTTIGSEKKGQKKDDPSASIMNLMKEMYDSGDDNMKKMIGETMLKQREGRLNEGDSGIGGGMGGKFDDLKM